MYTTCSHCHTRFRLTAAQLTAAQGQVRCGKCHEVFDAYEDLEGAEGEQRQLRTPAQDVRAGLPAEQDAELEAQIPPEYLEPEIRAESADPTILPMQVEDEATPELEMPLAVEDEPITSAPNLKAGSRKSPPPPIDDLFSSLPDDEPQELPLPEPLEPADAVVEAAVNAAESVPMYTDEVGAPASFARVEDLRIPPAPPKPRRVSGLWWLGVVVLLLVLGVQLVDMDRVALSQNPVIGPSLQALYAALGRPINKASSVADWNVGALNVTTDPDNAGALSITGSLTNGAGLVQPWPLLRVVLTDRFGAALRSRDFKPADYLPAGQAVTALAPGLTARFRLDIVDPGADAVGFSLSPCFDLPAGRTCAASTTND